MFKKIIVCLVFMSVILVSAVPALTKDKVTLWVGWPLLMPTFEKVEKDYEELNPDVDVEILAYDIREFERKLAITLPAGTGPDIFITSEYIAPMYIEAGYVAEPPEKIVEFVEDKYQSLVVQINTFDGKIYGVPHIGIARVLYWNKDMFFEEGIGGPPETWDELIDYAQKLAKYDSKGNLVRSGISMRLFGGGSGVTEKFAVHLCQAGGTVLGRTKDGKWRANYNNEAGVDTVKLYVDIVHKYKADSFDIKHDTEAFALELAAMYVRELFPIPQIREANPDLNFGTALMPRYKEWGTVFNTESAFVYKMTENYDLAWDLIEFFNQEKYLKEWFRNSGWVPPRIDIDFTDIFAEEPAYKTALEFPEGYIFATYPPLPCVDEIYTKLGERLEKAFRDSSLVDNPEGIKLVLEGAAEETNEILRENGLYGEGEIEPYWVISK